MKEEKSKVKEKTEKPMALTLTNVDKLIETAVKSKAGVEQLQALMKMKYEHEEREAAKLFHIKFCQMQAVFPVIQKTKEVKNYDGSIIYKYAPLEAIVKQILPYLKEYGFSYHWSESFEKEGYKRIICHITGHGHRESAYTDVPIPEKTKMTNNIQQAGSASTYGKRYSLCGILGIMADDDNDARSMESEQKKSAKNEPIKNVTSKEKPINVSQNKKPEKEPMGEVRETLQRDICNLAKKMGAKTTLDYRAKTGVTNLDKTEIELLEKIRDRLRKEIDEKNVEEKNMEEPIEDTKLPFSEEKSADDANDDMEDIFKNQPKEEEK